MAKSTQDILFRFLGDSKSLEAASRRSRGALDKTDSGARTAAGGIGTLGKAAIGLGAAFVAANIVQFGKDAITAASDYNESVNAMELTTGDASEAIALLGETADVALGLSMSAVNDAAVAFSAFGKAIDTDGDISDTFEDYITRATDFASVMNIDVADALRIFQSTLAGESEPIRRFGKDLSAAAVGAFAVRTGIVESAKAMTATEKTRARYGLLMEETSEVQGDFANTADEVANAQRIVNAEMENARIELGQNLIPVQEKWIEVQGLAVDALVGVTAAINDTASEQELLNRRFFDAAVEAGKVTGTYDEMVAGSGKVEDSGRDLSGVWDFLIGRTHDLDEELEDVRGTSSDVKKEFGDLGGAALIADSKLGDLDSELEDLEPRLVTVARLTDIFSGDLFAAARNARGLKRATDGLGALFAGGGGSGQTQNASGGPISAGQPTLVGERGPEVITSSRGGFVTPNHKLGGGGNTYNINVTAIDPAAAAEAVADAIRLYESTNGPVSG